MANHPILKANKREVSGSSASRRLRREGVVPGVIYGSTQDNYSIQVDARDFSDLLKGTSSANFLVDLQIAEAKEKSKLAMVQAVQQDPLSGALVHIDFHAVKEDELVHANVPIQLLGECAGVKEGGVLDHQLHDIDIQCRPADLPDHLELDVSGLGLGQAAHISDLKLPEGVETHLDGDVVVALVSEPRVAGDDEEAAEGAPTEPAKVGEEESDDSSEGES